MVLFFKVRGSSPLERGFRAIGMVLVILVVVWAFWKNNENMLQKMQTEQRFWDETGQASAHIKTFCRDFADSFEHEFGIKARVQIVKGEAQTALPEADELVLSLSPSLHQARLRVNPEGEGELELIKSVENGHFTQWEDWEPELESALVLIWNHYSSQQEDFRDIVAQDSLTVDETGTLTAEDLAFLDRFTAGLEREFGQQAVVHVLKGRVVVPELDNRTLFVGLSPANKEVIIALPPLIRRSLRPGFEQALVAEHFPPYFESGDWPQGLKTALIKLWQALAGENME